MSVIKFAVIGCGVIAQKHLEALKKNPQATVEAVCDLREETAKATAEAFEVKRWTTEATELINDADIDAVLFALPTFVRTELAVQALKQGKHVLLEKPIAMNAAEVEQLMAAQGDRVVACCSSRMSLLQTALKAKEAVESGLLGDIRVIHCRAVLGLKEAPKSPPPVWRLNSRLNGGGILFNWGCYDLDFLFSIVGWNLEPTGLLAQTWQHAEEVVHHAAPQSDAETHIAAMVRFSNNSVLHYERAEMTSAQTQESWQIVGSKATLRLHLYKAKTEVFIDELDPVEGVKTRTLFHNPDNDEFLHGTPSIDFVDAILNKREPKTGLKESLMLAKMMDAMYESARSGKPIEL